MEWTQLVLFFIGVFGLFIWNRSENRTDIRHMDSKLEAQRNLINAIYQEGKEWHARMEKNDIEYRAIMAKQEAEYRAIMAKQDLEFKEHLKYLHSERLK